MTGILTSAQWHWIRVNQNHFALEWEWILKPETIPAISQYDYNQLLKHKLVDQQWKPYMNMTQKQRNQYYYEETKRILKG